MFSYIVDGKIAFESFKTAELLALSRSLNYGRIVPILYYYEDNYVSTFYVSAKDEKYKKVVDKETQK